jgi:hypothetical protein
MYPSAVSYKGVVSWLASLYIMLPCPELRSQLHRKLSEVGHFGGWAGAVGRVSLVY